jgi:hypothetical protein
MARKRCLQHYSEPYSWRKRHQAVGIPGLFIGNTAEEIIQTTKCSVLAVKPTGFISPVE